MGAKRVTPQEILEMQRLYRELGTYAAVAREVKRSADTVSKYVKMRGVPKNIRMALENLAAEKAGMATT